MMRRVILSILTFVLFLSGCYPNGSVGKTGYYEAYDIVRTSVPFAMDGANDKSRAKVELYETDEYGRQIFIYSQFSLMLQKSISIWLVCQKTDVEYAYYYSDVCYMIVDKGEVLDDGDLEVLKVLNDWNLKIDNNKMSKVRYVYSGDYQRFVDETDELLSGLLREYLAIDNEVNVMVDKLEINSRKQQIVLVREFQGGGLDGSEVNLSKLHIVLYDTHNAEIIYAVELKSDMCDDLYKIGEYIADFKTTYSF